MVVKLAILQKSNFLFFFIFKDLYLFIFRERRREGEREGGKLQLVASCSPPNRDQELTGHQTSDPSILQAGTQSTEPHQPGLGSSIFNRSMCYNPLALLLLFDAVMSETTFGR